MHVPVDNIPDRSNREPAHPHYAQRPLRSCQDWICPELYDENLGPDVDWDRTGWWQNEIWERVRHDDLADTTIFTIGTTATLAKLWYSPGGVPVLVAILGALSFLSSFLNAILLLAPRHIFLRWRDPWAIFVRFVRPLFALYCTPHLDVFPPGSYCRAIFLFLLSTGLIPLSCSLKIRLKLRHHVIVQAIVVALYLALSPTCCSAIASSTSATDLLNASMQALVLACLGPALSLTGTADALWSCQMLHIVLVVGLGFIMTSHTVYCQDRLARSKHYRSLGTSGMAQGPGRYADGAVGGDGLVVLGGAASSSD